MPQTGPITAEGKRKSSLNSIRHGLNSEGFLPCKRRQCFYWSGCPCRERDGHLPDHITFGSDCPNELANYRLLTEQYKKAFTGDSNNRSNEIHQLVMNELHLMRVRSAIAINSNLVRQIPSGILGYERPAPTLPFRYRHELTKMFYSQLTKSFPIIKEVLTPYEGIYTSETV